MRQTLRSRTVEYQGDLLRRFAKEVLPKIVDGQNKLIMHCVLPWAKIIEATKIMEGAQNTGKIVCTIDAE